MSMYKEIYGEGLNDVVPASSVLQDIIPMAEDKLGDSYRQSVVLTGEHGFTYNGSGGAVVTLNAPVQASIVEGNTSGFEMIGASRITYAAASRGQSSKTAFKKTWDTVLLNLKKASSKRLELTLLAGQDGIAGVTSLSSETATLKDPAEYSAAIIAGLEGCVVEVFIDRAASSTEHGATAGSTIDTLSLANGTLTSTSGGFSGGTAVDADDVIYFNGARTASAFNEPPGMRKIISNSGTLFGINSATYNLWAGNTKSSFGTPTMGKFLDGVTTMVERGLDEKVFLLVCPKTWEVLNADLAAMRKYDGSYSKAKAENGAQSIMYYGQVGEIEVRVHPFLWRGEAMLFPKSVFKRVGSADLGMGVPGTDGRDVFFHVPSTNAVEARTFSDQALWCDAPSRCSLVSGITYP